MARQKAPAWTSQEISILSDIYPREGINGAADALPDRSWRAIEQMAFKLQLRSPIVSDAPKAKLQGAQLEEAIRLREIEGWSFAKIGATLGVAEASACNAVLIALCPRKGFTPAQRDDRGRLLPEGLERLRYMLRKGLKAVDIQLRLGVSASCVAEQRRRYNADLKARGKATLPPPGGGEQYCGVPLAKAAKQEVERLFLEGLGTAKIHQATGVKHTSIVRIRAKLVKRLARKGQALPGCDITGKRGASTTSTRYISPDQVEQLRARILNREPTRRAALDLGIGLSSAYRIRDELRRELVADGETLPQPDLPGRGDVGRKKPWLPAGMHYRYRALVQQHGIEEAKRILLEQLADERKAVIAEARRPKSFEEQLAAVRNGARLVNVIKIRRPDPSMTLGGVASGAL